MCEFCDEERKRLTILALAKRMPCLVCEEPNVVGAASWIPDETYRIAVGGKDIPVFAFCLCQVHSEPTQENEKLIKQAVLRDKRSGRHFTV